MKRTNKKQKGFTLIELVVVIILIGILAGIAIPRMMNVTDTAEEATRKATARTIVSAITVAATAHNGDFKEVTADEVDKAVDVDVVDTAEAEKWSFTVTDTDGIQVFYGTDTTPIYKEKK